jgi:hypothetical protein
MWRRPALLVLLVLALVALVVALAGTGRSEPARWRRSPCDCERQSWRPERWPVPVRWRAR